MKNAESIKFIPNIPVDILIELFSSLPIETLVRCRSVCKLWFNILDDIKFIYDYLENGPVEFTHLALCKDEKNLIKRRKRRNQCYSFYLLKMDNSFGILEKRVWRKSEKPCNVMMKWKSFIVGCSKGVVCFIREKKMHFANPLFFNDVVDVALPGLTMDVMEGHDCSSYLSYSFGFDESSKRFKVFCVLQCHYACGHGDSTNAPLVLDLGVGKSLCGEVGWRMLSSKSIRHPCFRSKGCQSVFVDGAFVFLGSRRSPGVDNLEIFSFNLEKETFKEITLPDSAPVLENYMSLFDFNGSIGLLGLSGIDTMQIWVLDAYKDITTWNEKFLIKVPTNIFKSVHAVGINKSNCEIMFKIKFGGGYYAYNMKTGITTAPPDSPRGLDRILLQQGSLIRASSLAPLDCSS